MAIVVAVVAFVACAAAYLTWTAGRLDRLHARIDAAAAALDAQLVRRAAAAGDLAAVAAKGPAAERLAAAAAVARQMTGLGTERAAAENALSRVLRELTTARQITLSPDLREAAARLTIARAVHNDAVRDTLTIRRRRLPRLFRLAGRAPWPEYFDIDDTACPDGNDGAWPTSG